MCFPVGQLYADDWHDHTRQIVRNVYLVDSWLAKMHMMPEVAGLFPQTIFNFRALLRKMTYEDMASYAFSPPRSREVLW